MKTGFGMHRWSVVGLTAASLSVLAGGFFVSSGINLRAQQTQAAPAVDPQAAPAAAPARGRRGAAAAAGASQSAPDAEHGGAEGAAPAPPQAGAAPAAARGGLVAYPDRPKADPASVEAGKATFSVNCAFCHGSDAGGGSVGPNLQRSDVVLQDKHGELIMPIVHGGRVDRGMPKIDISDAQVSQVADWLHSIKISSRSLVKENINIVVGDAVAGKPAFDKLCSSCHSVTGDLKGFAAKYTDPRAMQQAWIMPAVAGGRGGGPGAAGPAVVLKVPPVTATVTQANGQKVTGLLDAVDDFYVAVTTEDGVTHRFSRWNDVPKVEIHDPLVAHRELLRKYNDKDIHDITAYLETLK
jgi:cytochrome c oxidase cbb3-type subunit III